MTDLDESTIRDAYAAELANNSFEWYRSHAIHSRRWYRFADSLLLALSALIPVASLLVHDNATYPGFLGAAVVIISGLKPIFHWHENYLRFSAAREAIEGERRLFNLRVAPYEIEGTRAQELAVAISRIEQEEMRGWLRIASPRTQAK
jgi:hypothetical protein